MENGGPFIPLRQTSGDLEVLQVSIPGGQLDMDLPSNKKPKRPRTWGQYLKRSFSEMLFGGKLNLLLLFIPVAITAIRREWGDNYVFVYTLLSLAPLAERLGYVTEQLALCTNATIGGLLNATFSNAPEMIICIMALKTGLVRVVQLSLLGSILGNLLLCLGSAFFAGGLVHKQLGFNQQASMMNTGLLLLAVMGLLFPNLLHATGTEIQEGVSELSLSRFSAVVMLIGYACFIYFQLVSHSHLYEESEEGQGEGEDGEEEEEQVLQFWGAIVWLAIITTLISALSDYLVTSISGAATAWKIPVAFLAVILMPVVNNVAEHASAIVFGVRDKLDISLGIAIGSSIQIAMFLVPFCVIGGWIVDVPMDLNFHRFETITLFVTIVVVSFLLLDGTANWLKGIMLILMYLILAATFFNHKEEFMPGTSPPPPKMLNLHGEL